MIRLMALAAVAAALILAAAGCGGSSSKSSAPATATTAESTDTSGASTEHRGTTPRGDGHQRELNRHVEDTVAKGCLDFAGASSKIGQALAAGASGGSTEDSEDVLRGPGGQGAVECQGRRSRRSPRRSASTPTRSRLQASSPAIRRRRHRSQKLQQASKEISTPEFKQASEDISAWVDGGCKS